MPNRSPLLFRRPAALVPTQINTRRALTHGDKLYRISIAAPHIYRALEALANEEYTRLEPIWRLLEEQLREPS